MEAELYLTHMNELIKKIKEARFVFICGNGGSAATAEHFTTDLVKKGYRAICLNSNVSVVTMIANDYGYENIFSKQLAVYANSRGVDLLITISCSGTSKNILNAIEYAKSKDIKVYEFETFSTDNDFGLLEDKHLKFAHEIAKVL